MSAKRSARLTPVVLAAGASSRMGQPKEFLEFSGVTCLERVLDACARGGLSDPILVTRGERAEALKARLSAWGQPAQVVINPRPELGQTSSLRAGLMSLPSNSDAFVIYPVDHPLVTAADVRRLADVFVDELARTGQRPALVAPSFAGRRGHPVIVDAALAPAILALPDGGSAREVLHPLAERSRYVLFDDDRVLVDMDTPEAYQACRRRLEASSG